MSHVDWNDGRKLLMTAGLMVAWGTFYSLWPVSWWLEVRKIEVHDTMEGECPTMSVDRINHRQFYGFASLQFDRVFPDGTLKPGPSISAPAPWREYQPRTNPNPITTLYEWAWGDFLVCEFTAGDYEMRTTYTVRPKWYPWMPERTFTVVSPFTILPRAKR